MSIYSTICGRTLLFTSTSNMIHSDLMLCIPCLFCCFRKAIFYCRCIETKSVKKLISFFFKYILEENKYLLNLVAFIKRSLTQLTKDSLTTKNRRLQKVVIFYQKKLYRFPKFFCHTVSNRVHTTHGVKHSKYAMSCTRYDSPSAAVIQILTVWNTCKLYTGLHLVHTIQIVWTTNLGPCLFAN